MKIIYFVDYYQPKLGYGSYFIPKELAKMGNEVAIYTSDHYYPFPQYEETAGKILGPRKVDAGTKNENGVKVIRKPLKVEIFTRAVIAGQGQFIKEFRPDIVIVDKTAGYNQVLASWHKHKYKYKLVSLDAHLPSGFSAEGNKVLKEIFYFMFRLFFSKLINTTTDRFIAVQESTKEIMTKYYGVTKKIEDIPLGTDLNVFKFNYKEREKIRKQYNIDRKDFVIIYTGKVIKEKGVDILFAALDILATKYKDIKLLIVGSGSDSYIEECYAKLSTHLHNRVILAGFKPSLDLYKYYSASDVGVWPLQESMSMNDAAACNLPFIANHTVGARLRLSNNNALLYKQGNAIDLAKQLEILIHDPKERKQMGKRGRELMEKELSWKRIAEKYIDGL